MPIKDDFVPEDDFQPDTSNNDFTPSGDDFVAVETLPKDVRTYNIGNALSKAEEIGARPPLSDRLIASAKRKYAIVTKAAARGFLAGNVTPEGIAYSYPKDYKEQFIKTEPNTDVERGIAGLTEFGYSLIPFSLASKAVGLGAKGLTKAQMIGRTAGLGGLLGAAQKPSEEEGDEFAGRIRGALKGAVMFGGFAAGALGLQHILSQYSQAYMKATLDKAGKIVAQIEPDINKLDTLKVWDALQKLSPHERNTVMNLLRGKWGMPQEKWKGWFEKNIGEPVYDRLISVIERYTPDSIKKASVYRFGQPKEYAKIAEDRLKGLHMWQDKAEAAGRLATEGLSQAESKILLRAIKEPTQMEILRTSGPIKFIQDLRIRFAGKDVRVFGSVSRGKITPRDIDIFINDAEIFNKIEFSRRYRTTRGTGFGADEYRSVPKEIGKLFPKGIESDIIISRPDMDYFWMINTGDITKAKRFKAWGITGPTEKGSMLDVLQAAKSGISIASPEFENLLKTKFTGLYNRAFAVRQMIDEGSMALSDLKNLPDKTRDTIIDNLGEYVKRVYELPEEKKGLFRFFMGRRAIREPRIYERGKVARKMYEQPLLTEANQINKEIKYIDDIEGIEGIGPITRERLRRAGYGNIDKISKADPYVLDDVLGQGKELKITINQIDAIIRENKLIKTYLKSKDIDKEILILVGKNGHVEKIGKRVEVSTGELWKKAKRGDYFIHTHQNASGAFPSDADLSVFGMQELEARLNLKRYIIGDKYITKYRLRYPESFEPEYLSLENADRIGTLLAKGNKKNTPISKINEITKILDINYGIILERIERDSEKGRILLDQIIPSVDRKVITSVSAWGEIPEATSWDIISQADSINRYKSKLVQRANEIKNQIAKPRVKPDIPYEVRQKMGEIETAGYPVARSVQDIGYKVETAKLFEEVANNPLMSTTDKALAEQSGWVKMPSGKQMGYLEDTYVHPAIADDINNITKSFGKAERVYQEMLSAWKMGKTTINPATHGRNIVSNTMLLEMSGVPAYRIPDLVSASIDDIAKNTELYQKLKAAGLGTGTFKGAEIESLRTVYGGKSSVSGMLEQAGKGLDKTFLGDMSRLYQLEEEVFKIAKARHMVEQGFTAENALIEGEKWLFNYNKVPEFIRKVRTGLLGSPFITFQYKAIPRVLEALIKNPLKVMKYPLAMGALEQYSIKKLGLTPQEVAIIKKDRPLSYILPFTDKEGNIRMFDLQYIVPYGNLYETVDIAGVPVPSMGFMQNPVISTPTNLFIFNKDPYTGKDIISEDATNVKQAKQIFGYLAQQLLPPLTPGVGYSAKTIVKAAEGRTDRYGLKYDYWYEVIGAITGMKTKPVDMDIESYKLTKRTEALWKDYDIRQSALLQDRSLTSQERLKQFEELQQERIRGFNKIWENYPINKTQPDDFEAEDDFQPI